MSKIPSNASGRNARGRKRFIPSMLMKSSYLRFAVVLFLAASLVVLVLPAHWSSASAQQNGEEAFNLKADHVLKAVRQAAEEDRAMEAEGRLTPDKSEIRRLAKAAAVERKSNGTISVRVAVQLNEENEAELKAAGFAVGARIGDIATVTTDVDKLPELASLPSVRRISASIVRHPKNDRARQSVGIDNSSGQRVVSQTGKGVVVAILDTGIDFRHPDFTVPGSNGQRTRIKAMLDMTVYNSASADWNYALPGQTANIGHLYTEADINNALAESPKPAQTSDIVKERDKAGHGTHVAATAAGNGLASPTPGTYAGMAPEADLIIVKASREKDGTDGFGSDDLVNGIAFVKQKAAELNEPFVINMSLGGHGGSPHDGTDPDERAIDNLVNSGTGRAVCVAAGNEGQSGGHASGTVTQGGDLALTLTDQNNPQSFTLYYANADRFGLTVKLPDGTTLSSGAFNGNSVSNQYITIYNGTDDKQDSDPSNNQSSLFVVIKDGAEKLGSGWTFTLHGNSVTNGHFDAWVDDGSFSAPYADDSREVGSPGTSRGAITVGAFVTRSSQYTVGTSAFFTSPGPTADGRQKPDISAPGYYLYSAKSSDIDSTNGITSFSYGTGTNAVASGVDTSKYGGLAGTSMATPVVTGSTALLLQANPNLTADQIKSYYFQTSTHDSFTGAGWETHFGNGKLNIAAAIRAAAPTLTPTVQLSTSTYSASESAGNIQVPVTLSVASSATVSVDYATSDTAGLTPCNTFNGIASSRCDYITSIGTLTFAPGETQKIIYIPLVADAYTSEGNETFSISLSNAQGAPLGSPSSATITILDNTTNTGNPIDNPNFFVRQQYLDFLDREPDAPGLGGWLSILGGCAAGDATCDRISVSSGFFLSPEFHTRGYYVFKFYDVSLGHQPNYSQFMPDLAFVSGFLTDAQLEQRKAQFAETYVARSSFQQTYGALDNTAYVNALLNTAGVTIADSQKQTWVNALNGGTMTRGQVLRAIVESSVVDQKFYNQAFVVMQYFGYLRRDPDILYLNWIDTLNKTGDYRTMINGFMNSAEYRQRFGQ
ncbi:MAG: hypothetical protein DMF68_10295 [Acidobacteria bacterium]|nr:MAG: hypothetical protein DMF68_10295 [Acidobacteriota bacterium]